MPKFSANLGYLWKDLPLPEAIHAAKNAGFDAVECHEPYQYPAEEVHEALKDTGFEMLGLNTRRGEPNLGERGLAAVPGRETDARNIIDEAIKYAVGIHCKNIHVIAGKTQRTPDAEETFQKNLTYAAQKASNHGKTILIEPLNLLDNPGYHLSTLDEALVTLEAVNHPSLKIMFDCYHLQIMQGNLLQRLQKHLPKIGHIQFANAPGRTEPDKGEINFPWLFAEIDRIGWNGFLGAEYIPLEKPEESLGWLQNFKSS